jgi:hypothetical protein
MRNRRLLRMMAGDVRSPSERYAERMARRDQRMMADFKNMLMFVDRVQRREKGDADLPPMPLNFAEIEKRRREGKR